MDITEVRIKLTEEASERLKAFCSITLDDCFVIRDLKIIEGTNGPFVAMPSRKLCDRCASCGGKNHMRARYCNDCGSRLAQDRAETDERGRPRMFADIAHPINQAARDLVQNAVLEAYNAEVERSKEAGYKAVEFDDLDYHYLEDFAAE